MKASTQGDRNMNFDGMESLTPQRSSKYKTNAWSGHSNDGRSVNMGRGPVRGNDGMCCQPKNTAGKPVGGPKPRPPSHVHDTHAPGAYGKAPYRGVGGTMPKKPVDSMSINYGPSSQY